MSSASRKRLRHSDEDIARFGEDAERGVVLLRVPKNVIETWRPLFHQGGLESNLGVDPVVPLGQATSEQIEDGSIISFLDAKGNPTAFKCKLERAQGSKSRLISAEVGEKAENVKFEGIITHTGVLMPERLDARYRETVRQRAACNETKSHVETVSLRGERERTTSGGGGRVIVGTSEPKGDESSSSGRESEPPKSGKELEKNILAKKKEKKDWTDDEVREKILAKFNEQPTWKRKHLRTSTGIQYFKMKKILDELCDYDINDKIYTLKSNNRG